MTIAVNLSRAICLTTAALRSINPRIQLVHVDFCEYHRVLNAQSEGWVRHVNHRRFLFHDLILGRMGADHPLLPYLRTYGFTEDHRYWFEEHAVQIDVLGLDYYAHAEIDWAWDAEINRVTLRFPCAQARGFAAVAGNYVERFRLPVLL